MSQIMGVCMKCCATFVYDPSRQHVCGEGQRAATVGGDVALRVEYELRRRLNEFERRLEALEAGKGGVMQEVPPRPTLPDFGAPKNEAALADDGSRLSRDAASFGAPGEIPEPKPRFDRRGYHRRYMRQWRARQSALRKAVDPA
jgi:hypothetical protein